MKIKCLGAGEVVTGSKYILTTDSHKNILIDCGVNQGEDADKLNLNAHRSMQNQHIDAVILTHAHLDHTGYLPQLFRNGFEGKVYCTPATKDLAKIILKDNAKILSTKPHDKEDLFYTEQDIKKALAHMHCHSFHECFEIFDLKIEFFIAGHILGAASVSLQSNSKHVLFSGDLGRFDDYVVQPAELCPNGVSTVIMESTYGDREHPKDLPEQELKEIIETSMKVAGTIIIPAFSLGRSQTLMSYLYDFFDQNSDYELPVYVDSPMTIAITDVYETYLNQHNISKEKLNLIKKKFHFIQYLKQRKKLAENNKPKIILTASGMLSGGYVLSHLAHYIEKPETQLILSGFQSPGTLGYQLLNKENSVTINEVDYNALCQIHFFNHFSSHQDLPQLLSWLKNCSPQKVYLSHGEVNAINNLKLELKNTLKFNCEILKIGKTFDVF